MTTQTLKCPFPNCGRDLGPPPEVCPECGRDFLATNTDPKKHWRVHWPDNISVTDVHNHQAIERRAMLRGY